MEKSQILAIILFYLHLLDQLIFSLSVFLSNQINISQLEYDDDKSPVYEDSKNSFSSSGVENIFVASE